MSQHSEERVPDEAAAGLAKGQVVPFERPQSELQKAVQQRAQEIIDRERDRAVQQRPPTWRRALVLALAAIPVFLTFGAAIGFVGALRQFNTAVFNSQPEATNSSPTEAPPTVAPANSSEPGVVMLQPYAVPAPKPDQPGASTVSPDRK